MPSRELKVVITGDSRNLERAFARSQKSAQQFQAGVTGRMAKVDAGLKKLGAGRAALIGGFAGAGAGIIAPKVIDQVQAAVSAASDLNEQITKNQQVFGASAKQVQEWSTTTAKSIGVSQSAALAATGTFGNLFTAIGITGPKAADMSRNLVTLAADLASFNNASIEDTLNAIRSGLVGEAEPLRRYGVLLSETRVAQVAMAQTGKTSAKALTDQEKAAARVAIIFRDTSKAQGDFARTSGGLANQQRILKAEVADLQANLGRLLLPAITKITGALVTVTGTTLDFANALERLGNAKIPPIHIPLFFDFPGGTIFGGVGKGLHIGAEVLKNLPMNRLAIELAQAIGDRFGAETAGQTPALAQSFRTSIETFTQNALDQAATTAKPKRRTKGFGTGLTPTDLFGPQITDIPKALQENLLDAELTGKGIRDALVRQRDVFVRALDDPRNDREDRIKIKTALKGVKDRIAAIDADVASGLKAAADARTARLRKIAEDAKAARERHRQHLRDIAEQRRKAAADAAEALQAHQFRAIGLTGEGQELTPTATNLKKQFDSLSKRVVGENVPSKLLGRLRLVGKALAGGIQDMKQPTRQAIKELFDEIRATFDNESKKAQGPLTKTTSLNTQAALANVTGLSRDQLKQIRANLSNFNSAGVALAGSATGVPITVNTNTTINLDGETVARNTTKHQQKANRRNPPQKRGPNRRGI